MFLLFLLGAKWCSCNIICTKKSLVLSCESWGELSYWPLFSIFDMVNCLSGIHAACQNVASVQQWCGCNSVVYSVISLAGGSGQFHCCITGVCPLILIWDIWTHLLLDRKHWFGWLVCEEFTQEMSSSFKRCLSGFLLLFLLYKESIIDLVLCCC